MAWERVTRHYGDVREPVISDAQIRIINETSLPFTLPSKSSYLDSFFIALTISTRSDRYTLIHRLIINTFWPWRALVHYFCLTSQTKHSGFIITQFIFDQDQ